MIFLMESVTPSSRGAVSGDETGFKRHEPVPFSLDERVLAGNGREASDRDAMCRARRRAGDSLFRMARCSLTLRLSMRDSMFSICIARSRAE